VQGRKVVRVDGQRKKALLQRELRRESGISSPVTRKGMEQSATGKDSLGSATFRTTLRFDVQRDFVGSDLSQL